MNNFDSIEFTNNLNSLFNDYVNRLTKGKKTTEHLTHKTFVSDGFQVSYERTISSDSETDKHVRRAYVDYLKKELQKTKSIKEFYERLLEEIFNNRLFEFQKLIKTIIHKLDLQYHTTYFDDLIKQIRQAKQQEKFEGKRSLELKAFEKANEEKMWKEQELEINKLHEEQRNSTKSKEQIYLDNFHEEYLPNPSDNEPLVRIVRNSWWYTLKQKIKGIFGKQ